MQDSYDAVVLGAGSGGLTVAYGLSVLGKHVALLETRHVGGDCTNTGCIPSKTFVHQSKQPFSADPLDHVRQKRDALRDEETRDFSSFDNLDLIFARGRLLSSTTVEISANGATKVVRAANIIIATGSRPRVLPIHGLADELNLTSDTFFEQNSVPENLAIIGAGPVGLELATACSRLCSSVTIIEAAPQLLANVPDVAVDGVRQSLSQAGVTLIEDATATGYSQATRTVTVRPNSGRPDIQISPVNAVMTAIGRVPNTENLGLDELNIATNQGHIVTNSKGQTSLKGVWAVGDAADKTVTTHGANAWGRRIVKAIAFPFMPASKEPLIPTAIYTSPEVASIGVHPNKVPAHLHRIVIDLSTVDRAYTEDVQFGVVVLDVRRLTGKVEAATIVAPNAGDLIGTLSLAMTNGLRLHKWYPTVWAYPTYSGAIGKAVDIHMAETLTNIGREARRWVGGIRR